MDAKVCNLSSLKYKREESQFQFFSQQLANMLFHITVFCIAANVDECTIRDKYQCFGDCINVDGFYKCVCPLGTSGNPMEPHGCIQDTEKFSGNTGNNVFQQPVASQLSVTMLSFVGKKTLLETYLND
jgi:hypothetical protein